MRRSTSLCLTVKPRSATTPRSASTCCRASAKIAGKRTHKGRRLLPPFIFLSAFCGKGQTITCPSPSPIQQNARQTLLAAGLIRHLLCWMVFYVSVKEQEHAENCQCAVEGWT